MNPDILARQALHIAHESAMLSMQLHHLRGGLQPIVAAADPFIYLLAIFLMACFVGYYVVWNVTPALHSPLMAVTNAISSVIIVGAMLATGLSHGFWPGLFGFLAVTLASVNIFGGFLVTQRMLSMFRSKK
jgi:H+-translocating NAD(P) transhydrogenase subunit alpha